jgi:hypothetical protein
MDIHLLWQNLLLNISMNAASKNRLILGFLDYPTSAIVGYLGISQVYYPRGDRFGSYIRWDKQRLMGPFTQQEVVDKARQLKTHELTDGNSQDVLIILNKPLNDELVRASKLQKIAEFTGALLSLRTFIFTHLTKALAFDSVR